MQDVHNILLYCNTDVVITKPVTGRASICSATLQTTKRLIASGFIQKKKFVNNHISVIQFRFTQYAQYIAIYCPMQYTVEPLLKDSPY